MLPTQSLQSDRASGFSTKITEASGCRRPVLATFPPANALAAWEAGGGGLGLISWPPPACNSGDGGCSRWKLEVEVETLFYISSQSPPSLMSHRNCQPYYNLITICFSAAPN